MSDGLNKVMLIGNLGSDPELRSTSGGNAVLNMRLACSETYLDKNRQRQEKTEWVNVVLWGKRAEALSKILIKGSRIFVEGSLRTSTYDDKQGQKRYKTEVNATNVILCGGRSEQRSAQSQPTEQSSEFGADDGFEQQLDGDGFPF
jgi:single-strand DNA-binding protein